jgi:hypothetical protein
MSCDLVGKLPFAVDLAEPETKLRIVLEDSLDLDSY